MPSNDTCARPATTADVPRAARTLHRAFTDDVFTRHVLAADDHLERLERFQELFVGMIGLGHGRVWVAGDVGAVAVWTPPETTGEIFAELAPRFAELAGDRLEVYEASEAVMSAHRPDGPLWFLGVVGVDPARQRRGLGGAVIRPGLEAAGRDGVPAFLETSVPRNVPFRARETR